MAPALTAIAALVLALQAPAENDSRFSSFDKEIEAYMRERDIPGGSVAVTRNGRLVYARGYGLADIEGQAAATPESLFRIASISKPITAVAILKLIRDGKLKLDEKAFPFLGVKPIRGKNEPDPRLAGITVFQLLHHTGGWDRSKSGDPMFRSVEIARAAGKKPPADPDAIIRFMAGRPLDFDPGTRYAYSNFGYCVLGRIIEKVTGRSYGEYVRESILKPMGITRMRLGRSLKKDRLPGEVLYYQPDAKLGPTVFPEATEPEVPWTYGAFCMEALDAHGGWVASAVDLARFATSFDKVLDKPGVGLMFARPSGLKEKPAYYALGWMVRPVGKGGKANTWHGGSLPGTNTLLVRRHDGLTWAVLFNRRSRSFGKIDPAMHRAADAVTEWPPEDLFPKFR